MSKRTCPVEGCEARHVSASMRFHLIRCHGLSRTAADRALEGGPLPDADRGDREPAQEESGDDPPAEPNDGEREEMDMGEQTLPERIKNAREAAGLSQKDLADLVGVHHGSVSHWEIGRSAPRGENAERLEEVLNALERGEVPEPPEPEPGSGPEDEPEEEPEPEEAPAPEPEAEPEQAEGEGEAPAGEPEKPDGPGTDGASLADLALHSSRYMLEVVSGRECGEDRVLWLCERIAELGRLRKEAEALLLEELEAVRQVQQDAKGADNEQ